MESMKKHKYNYDWTLKDANFTKDKGTVFSCFSCGGGSTMGYKLAGFDVIGCNEIDPKMMEAYIANHSPKYSYLEPIQDFKLRKDLPKELYELDILDGSPPCSSFSIAGNREKDWGKNKKFREGQQNQVLDNLFFDFIDLAKELQPKVVIAENVKGLLIGNAKKYVSKIYSEFDKAGYYCNHYLLDASKMGVPQRRERVFFVCLRKDLIDYVPQEKTMFHSRPYLDMEFNEQPILYKTIKNGVGRKASKLYYERWKHRVETDNSFGDITLRINNSGSCFSDVFAKNLVIAPTATSKGGIYDFDTGHFISTYTFCNIGTYPQDYDFKNNKPHYIIGMSVPPVMAAQVASRVLEQWLNKINKDNK